MRYVNIFICCWCGVFLNLQNVGKIKKIKLLKGDKNKDVKNVSTSTNNKRRRLRDWITCLMFHLHCFTSCLFTSYHYSKPMWKSHWVSLPKGGLKMQDLKMGNQKKMKDMKIQDLKMTDQFSGLAFSGPAFSAPLPKTYVNCVAS